MGRLAGLKKPQKWQKGWSGKYDINNKLSSNENLGSGIIQRRLLCVFREAVAQYVGHILNVMDKQFNCYCIIVLMQNWRWTVFPHIDQEDCTNNNPI